LFGKGGETIMKYAITSARQSIDSYGQEIIQFETAYAEYLSQFRLQLFILPHISDIHSIEKLTPNLILLPGGGDVPIQYYESSVDVIPQNHRDSNELLLIDYAIKRDIPILGICRGMQMLNGYFSGKITRCSKHDIHPVAENHAIKTTNDGSLYMTNSFHQDVIHSNYLSPSFRAIAVHETENHIEAMVGIEHYILGIQWHPERMENSEPCYEYTNTLINSLLEKKEIK